MIDSILLAILVAIFPVAVVIGVNVFCLRVAREVAPMHAHVGSIITSPFLYIYFCCVLPISLISAWFPMGISLLFLYGEEGANLLLPAGMNEELVVLITYLVITFHAVLLFSIRAGELHRIFAATLPPGQLQVPKNMVV